MPRVSLIEDLTKGPIPAGSNILVEFDPVSQWFAASLAIAAGWVKDGGKVYYNVASQPPEKLRTQLKQLHLNVEELERTDNLRIMDYYTLTLGQKSNEKFAPPSLKAHDLSIFVLKTLSPGPPTPDILRITDNFSVLARFNEERPWIEYELTRGIPAVSMRKAIAIRGLIRGLHSEWVYKNLEAANDGVIEFRLEESENSSRNTVRVRSMRNIGFDSRLHQIDVGDNFHIVLDGDKTSWPSM